MVLVQDHVEVDCKRGVELALALHQVKEERTAGDWDQVCLPKYATLKDAQVQKSAFSHFYFLLLWGRGDEVVRALDFRSEGRWFETQSLLLCCFLIQKTLPLIVSLHPDM